LVEVARTRHNIALDWSDGSVEQIESLADVYWRTRPQSPPDPAAVQRMLVGIANDLGGYVGEVFRRNHGGEWGWVTGATGDRFPGMRAPSGQMFWPSGRARNRLADGPENNIWDYYQMLVEAETQAAGSRDI
jgi:hypothetical protein